MKNKVTILFLLGLIIFLSFEPEPQRKDFFKPNDWFFQQRAYPYAEINHEQYYEAMVQVKKIKEEVTKEDKEWIFAGPSNIGGRLSDVEMHPTDQQVIYYGAASGGIFKSQDGGNSFVPVFDEMLSLSIGDIALAPSNPDIVYVGTGEANCGGGSLAYEGNGIYRSEDAGLSWSHLGLEESRNIGRMVVHPENPDIVYVAAMGSLFADNPDRGVFKTIDGGQFWEKVLYVNDSTGAIDIVIHPNEPDIVYAASWERVRRPDRRSYGGVGCGIYKTIDGGQNWIELSNGLPSPASDIGRIGIDICDAEPEVLYAIYADDIGYFEGIYKTVDGGESWNQTNDGSLSGAYSSYGWWFGRIEVDPTDPDIAFPIMFDLYRTTNGGNSYSYVSSNMHVDQHAVAIHPQDNSFVVTANDGGLYLSYNGGTSWDIVDDLPITQFYTCEIDEQNPQRLYGGTQDNGTNRTLTGNLDDWQNIYWGDGFYVLVDPSDNNYVYAEYQYGNFARSTNGGYSFSSAMNGINSSDRMNWNTPVAFDPNNPSTLYYGSNKLYKSTNRAMNWNAISGDLSDGGGNGNLVYGTITTINVSALNEDLIYVGTDDGNVWRTDNGGDDWISLSSGLPDRWITRLTADPMEENTIYVCLSGFRWNDFASHLYKSTDRGESWENIGEELPDIPLNDLVVDPQNNQKLYLASDAGVFVSRDGGMEWEPMGTGMPTLIVNDLKLHNDTRKIVAATFGRGMYSYDLYQDTITNVSENVIDKGKTLLVRPNPIADYTHISLCGENDVNILSLMVSDFNGRHVFSRQINAKSFVWKNIDLPSGIYILSIKTGDNWVKEKIIISR